MLSPGPDAESVSFGNWLLLQRELREISLLGRPDVVVGDFFNFQQIGFNDEVFLTGSGKFFLESV